MRPFVLKHSALLAVLLLAIMGVGLMLYITHWGIGTSPDSISYIEAARSLLAGRGLTAAYGENVGSPMTFRAPFYSLLLSAMSLSGIDPLLSARWLNAFLFGANIFLVGLLIYSIVKDNTWLPFLGSLFVFTSLAMLNIHAYAWTEPLFILLGFSGFLFLVTFIQKERYAYLLLAAILMGLGVLTRYAGLPLIATGSLGILLFSGQGYSRRLFDALLFGMIGVLPFGLWSVRNTVLVGSSAGRSIGFHPLGMSDIWQAIYTFSGWMQLPDFVPGMVRLLILLLVGGGLLFLILRPSLSKSRPDAENSVPILVKLLLLYVFIYLAFLAVSISFLDANTPLDDRILSSVFIAVVVVAVYVLAVLWRQTKYKKALGFVFAGLGLLFFLAAFTQNRRWVSIQRERGLGFTSLAWQESDLMSELNHLPEDMLIYSNVPEAIYLHTGKSALSFPKKENVTTNQAEANYAEKLLEMQTKLTQESGVIIFFTAVRPEAGQIITELQAEIPLIIVIETDDGMIYALNENSTY